MHYYLFQNGALVGDKAGYATSDSAVSAALVYAALAAPVVVVGSIAVVVDAVRVIWTATG